MADEALNASMLDAAILESVDLRRNGYEYTNVGERNTPALGSYLEAAFTHPDTQRRITITYLPESPEVGAKAAVTLHITKNAADPYSDSFGIDEFLKHSGSDPKLIHALGLGAHVGSTRERIRAVLIQMAAILKTELTDVVAGRIWADVPIDWHGYK